MRIGVDTIVNDHSDLSRPTNGNRVPFWPTGGTLDVNSEPDSARGKCQTTGRMRTALNISREPGLTISAEWLHHVAQLLSFRTKVCLVQWSGGTHMLLTRGVDTVFFQPCDLSRIIR